MKQLSIAFMLATLVRGRMGGTEVYANELVPRIATQLKKVNEKSEVIQVLSSNVSAYEIDSQQVKLTTLLRGISDLSRGINYVFQNLTTIKSNADIAFYPFTAVIPRVKKPTKTVVTIHDLQHRDLPQLFSKSQRVYRFFTYERPASKSDAIVVISDFTQRSVIKELGVDKSKVHRIYPGVDHEFFHFDPRKNWNQAGEGFLYFPARGLPHKNHHRLFSAMVMVRKTYPDLQLVLTGADQGMLGELPEFVIHEGHVSRRRVLELYKSADALVFPSLYEGFGLPPIEAMAVGCPVISSRAGSLFEVCGDGATFIDPLSVEDIARGIIDTLADPESKIEAGKINAARFNWDIAAQEHIKLFKELTD